MTANQGAPTQVLRTDRPGVAATEATATRRRREVAFEQSIALRGQPAHGRADRVAVGVVGSGEEHEEARLGHGTEPGAYRLARFGVSPAEYERPTSSSRMT